MLNTSAINQQQTSGEAFFCLVQKLGSRTKTQWNGCVFYTLVRQASRSSNPDFWASLLNNKRSLSNGLDLC